MKATPIATKSLEVRALAADEPIADLDRWLAQYVAAVARLEGLAVPSTDRAA